MKRLFCLVLVFAFCLRASHAQTPGQEEAAKNRVLRVNVSLVLLNVAVTDDKGNYVTGLHPSDFEIFEDGIPQKIANFGEGNGPQQPVTLAADGKPVQEEPVVPPSSMTGADIFILFDTSNYMYRGFAQAQDAIQSLCARSIRPNASPSMPTAAIFIADRSSPQTVRRCCVACAPPPPATIPHSTTRFC
jgi:hypothetical protein